MSDFKIGASSGVNPADKDIKKKSPFYTLKDEYLKAKKNLAKTDFANSPVVIENEITILKRLRFLAEKEGLEDELREIEDKIETLYISLTANFGQMPPSAYYPPINLQDGYGKILDSQQGNPLYSAIPDKTEFDEDEYLNKFMSLYAKEELPDSLKDVVLSWGRAGTSPESGEYIIRKCTKLDGSISDEHIKAVDMMIKAGVESSCVPQLLEEISVKTEDSPDFSVDLDLCKTVCDMKSLGVDDLLSLKYAKLLNKGFSDKNVFNDSITKLSESGISQESVLELLDILKTKNPQNNKFDLKPFSVKSVCRCKKVLAATRVNEKDERDNPINTKGVQKIPYGDDIMVIKDGKISFISSNKDASVQELQKQYDEYMSNIEDKILCDFAAKYKDKNGDIPNICSRVFVKLRRMGICYEQLLPLMAMCVPDGENVNKNATDTVKALKEGGMLSEDIPDIIPLIRTDKDGNYNKADIETAIELTKALISGKAIADILPKTEENEEFKELAIDLSGFIPSQESMENLTSFIGQFEGLSLDNVISSVYNLAELLLNKEKPVSSQKFIEIVKNLILNSLDGDEKSLKLGDGATGIIAVMSKASKSVDEMISVITACKDESGIVDEKLADIAWDEFVNLESAADTDEVIEKINAAKNTEI